VTGDERRARAAAMLCERNALRMAIVGSSMQPSLRQPMILQVGSGGEARVGDVLIFLNGTTHVAHRVIGTAAGEFRTAGDAQPHVVERVSREAVIGRVVAVWSDASPDAARVDGALHRLRGWYFARFHFVRGALQRARMKASDLLQRAQPRLRRRAVPRLIDALSGACRNDAARLVRALDVDPEAFRVADERHRTAAAIGEAVRKLDATADISAGVATMLRRARLDAVLGATRMQRAVEATVEALRATGVPFALLKGAARVYAGDPEAAYHQSDDVDVLLRRADVDRVVAALIERGWTYRDDPASVERFARIHHHAASLFPPAGEFPLELHHALAPPGALSIATTWDALHAHLIPLEGPAGPVLRLDAVGTALHLAVHAIGLTRLRDTGLLARLLGKFGDAEREELRLWIGAERRDPVRLAAAVVLAAHVAGIEWPHARPVDAYIDWALRREDLPQRLRTRCDVVEARMAWPGSLAMSWLGLVPQWSHGAQQLALPLRIPARCIANVMAFAYSALMPPAGELLLNDQALRTEVVAYGEHVARDARAFGARRGDDVVDDRRQRGRSGAAG
jgi:hypothetical protein